MKSLLTLAPLGLAGCFGPVETEFPEGIAPLEANTAAWPDDVDDDALNLQLGETDDWVFGHGRGYLPVGLEAAWGALKTPEVGIDRRSVTEYSVDYDVEPEYDVSYVVHAVVPDIITVEYDLTWRQSLVDDDTVGIRWQKTEGSTFIHLLEGSIILTAVDDDHTGFEVVEHLDAPQTADARIERITVYLTDLFASARAASVGDPLPTYPDAP